MIILEDTRQQEKKHSIKNKYFADNGIEVRRTKLYVGDYTLPTNQSVCVDTKEKILEICANVCGKEHARFMREIQRAEESNIKLYVVVENEDKVTEIRDLFRWFNPRTARYNKIVYMKRQGKWLDIPLPKAPPTTGATLAKALLTIESKHPCVKFLFCTPKESGKVIIDLLTGEEQ